MVKLENQVNYWKNRALNAEAMLKNEEHVLTFTISYIKRVHPAVHKEMCDFFEVQSEAVLRAQRQSFNQRRRGRMLAA